MNARLAYVNAALGIPVQGPTGASSHVRGLTRALRRQSTCQLFSTVRVDHRGWYGAPVPAITSRPLGWPSWLRSFRELREVRSARLLEHKLRSWRPQVLLERHSLFSDIGWRVAVDLGIPWALEVNAPLLRERQHFEVVLREKMAQQWERDVLQAAPILFGVSRWICTWLRDELDCDRVILLPNGTSSGSGDAQRGRHILGVPVNRKIIGFVGSGRPWHCEKTLEGLARLDAEFVEIGRSLWMNQADLADVIAAFDVAVAPYIEDAPPWFCPLKLLDYRAQGVPIVASSVGDIPEIIGSGKLIEPGRQEDFIAAVAESLQQDQRPDRWCRSWDAVASELLSVLVPMTVKNG